MSARDFEEACFRICGGDAGVSVPHSPYCPSRREPTDELGRLREENERLRETIAVDGEATRHERDKAEAEIERLRTEVQTWQEEASRCGSRKQARDEVEQLRTHPMKVYFPREDAEKLIAENERLREDLERACEDPDAAVREENERLRVNLKATREWSEKVAQENVKLLSEVEHLRRAPDALSQSYAAEREMVERLLEDNMDLTDACDEKDAENERLRADLKGGRAKAIEQRNRAEARAAELENEVERLRALIYRMTAPTASMLEENDRLVALKEGRAIGLATLKGGKGE